MALVPRERGVERDGGVVAGGGLDEGCNGLLESVRGVAAILLVWCERGAGVAHETESDVAGYILCAGSST